MGINSSFAARDARAQRAALRDGVLQCGRLLGWPTRTVIALTEQVARRPWKRCGRAELGDVLDQLHAVVWAYEVRKSGPPTSLLAPALVLPPKEGRRAPGR